MRMKFLLIFAALTAPLIQGTASAADRPAGDPDRGRGLARLWCSSCHIIGPGIQGTDSAPPFAAIAERRKSDPDWVRGWLAAPHPPMPNLSLARAEIDDLVSYLWSLSEGK